MWFAGNLSTTPPHNINSETKHIETNRSASWFEESPSRHHTRRIISSAVAVVVTLLVYNHSHNRIVFHVFPFSNSNSPIEQMCAKTMSHLCFSNACFHILGAPTPHTLYTEMRCKSNVHRSHTTWKTYIGTRESMLLPPLLYCCFSYVVPAMCDVLCECECIEQCFVSGYFWPLLRSNWRSLWVNEKENCELEQTSAYVQLFSIHPSIIDERNGGRKNRIIKTQPDTHTHTHARIKVTVPHDLSVPTRIIGL